MDEILEKIDNIIERMLYYYDKRIDGSQYILINDLKSEVDKLKEEIEDMKIEATYQGDDL